MVIEIKSCYFRANSPWSTVNQVWKKIQSDLVWRKQVSLAVKICFQSELSSDDHIWGAI